MVPEPGPGEKVLTKSDTHSKSPGKWEGVLGKAVPYEQVTNATQTQTRALLKPCAPGSGSQDTAHSTSPVENRTLPHEATPLGEETNFPDE